MQKINLEGLNEYVAYEKLDNNLDVYVYRKKDFHSFYAYYVTNYGALNTEFVPINEEKMHKFPDGIAHFLEHKMFEKEDGHVLEKFPLIGGSSNAFTSYTHTVYQVSGTEKFYDNLNLLINFVEHPYFTDKNVEKEKGIIKQELFMGKDNPYRVFAFEKLKNLFVNLGYGREIVGEEKDIDSITKEDLYKCYNTFYNPANMAMVICGDFEPEKLLEEIKKRLIEKKANGEIKRIYPEEPESIVKEKTEQKMDVSEPLFTIGIKDKVATQKEKVKKHLAIEILLNMLIGKSSDLYQELYKSGVMFSMPGVDYEFSRDYAHILVTGQSKEPEKVYESFKNTIRELKEKGIESEEFKRMKKMLYGSFIKEYDEPGDIARMFLADFFKGINSFEYLEEITTINEQYVEQILNEVFNENKMILSVIKK